VCVQEIPQDFATCMTRSANFAAISVREIQSLSGQCQIEILRSRDCAAKHYRTHSKCPEAGVLHGQSVHAPLWCPEKNAVNTQSWETPRTCRGSPPHGARRLVQCILQCRVSDNKNISPPRFEKLLESVSPRAKRSAFPT
jgi:hypothetical protein